ncbi:IS3 family transposase [Chryseobacterium populi]
MAILTVYEYTAYNAVAESFFKILKIELIYQNKYETRDHAKKLCV